MRTANLFNGTVLEFPNETTDEIIDQVAKRETLALRPSTIPQAAEEVTDEGFTPAAVQTLPIQAPAGFLPSLKAGATEAARGVGEAFTTAGKVVTGRGGRTPLPEPAAKPDPFATAPWSQKLTSRDWWGRFIGQTSVSSTPFLAGAAGGAATFAAAGLAAGPAAPVAVPALALFGAMLGGGSAAGMQQLGQTYIEARHAGKPHDEAVDISLVSGLASAGINAASIPVAALRLLKGPVSNALLQTFVVQPGIGIIDQGTQNVVAKITYDPDRPVTKGAVETYLGEALFEAPGTVGVVAGTRAGQSQVPSQITPAPVPAPPVPTSTPPVAAPATAAPDAEVQPPKPPGPAGVRGEPVTITETGEVEKYETVLETIRSSNAQTRREIQSLFPAAQLSNEQAARLRNQAWPEAKVLESQGKTVESVPEVSPVVPAVAPTIAPVEAKASTPVGAVPAPTAKPEVVSQPEFEAILEIDPAMMTDEQITAYFDRIGAEPLTTAIVRDPYVYSGFNETIANETEKLIGKQIISQPDEITGKRRVLGRTDSVAAEELRTRMKTALDKIARGEKITQNETDFLNKWKSNAMHEAERFAMDRIPSADLKKDIPQTALAERQVRGGVPVSVYEPSEIGQKKAGGLKVGQTAEVLIDDVFHPVMITEKRGETVKLQDDVEVTMNKSDKISYVKGTMKEPVPGAPVKAISGKILGVIDAVEKQARADLALLKRPGALGAGKPIGITAQYVIIGMAKLARGTVKFSQWAREMYKEFGPDIRPYLRHIFQKSNQLLKEQHTDAVILRTRAGELAGASLPAKVTPKAVKEFIGQKPQEKVYTEPQALKIHLTRVQKLSKEIVGSTVKQQTETRRELVQIINTLPRDMRADYLKAVAGAKDEASIGRVLTRLERGIEQSQSIKTARSALEKTIETKSLKNWDNVRQAMKLPPIAEMNSEQFRQLNDVLSKYQTDDEFLPVRQLETIEKTPMKGLKTRREVLEHLAKTYNLKGNEMPDIKPHPWMYDAQLARNHPFYDLLVNRYNLSYLRSASRSVELEREVGDLIRKARDSRARSLTERAIPTDKRIIEWLEADEKTRTTMEKSMTPDEQSAAKRMDEVFGEYYDWMVRREIEKKFGSRFEDKYFPHVRRGFLEAWKEDGIVAAFKEQRDQSKQEEKMLTILDQKTGEILPYQKWVGFTQFRTGGLVPTQNAAKAFKTYVNALEKAKQWDEFIPEIMIYVHALTPATLTERGVAVNDSLKRFVKEWINSKKGRTKEQIVKQGSRLDWALRMGVAFTRIRDLGLNVPVGIANIFGEQAGNLTMLGAKNYIRGTSLLATSKGQRIVKKYENFVGRSVWEQLHDAANDIGDDLSAGLFGIFSQASERGTQVFLLGSMTPEEIRTKNISEERLARLRTDMGEYRVVEGSESVFGKTTEGAVGGQYKRWAVPILASTYANIMEFSKLIGKTGAVGALRSKAGSRLFYSIVLGSAVGLGLKGYYDELGKDKDRNFLEQTIYKSMRDALSLIGVLDPKFIVGFVRPRLAEFIYDLGGAIHDVLWLERSKGGDLKGVDKLAKIITPLSVAALAKEAGVTETKEDKAVKTKKYPSIIPPIIKKENFAK